MITPMNTITRLVGRVGQNSDFSNPISRSIPKNTRTRYLHTPSLSYMTHSSASPSIYKSYIRLRAQRSASFSPLLSPTIRPQQGRPANRQHVGKEIMETSRRNCMGLLLASIKASARALGVSPGTDSVDESPCPRKRLQPRVEPLLVQQGRA